MRFRTNRTSSPRPGLSRKDQWRWIVVIFVIGAGIAAFDLLRIADETSNGTAESRESATPGASTSGPLVPVVTQQAHAATQDGSDDETIDPLAPQPEISPNAPEAERGPIGLTNEDWNVFTDNTPGLSRAAGSVYYQALRNLDSIRATTLQRIARRDVAYSVLMADSERYRGQVVLLRGQVRRLTPSPVHGDVEDVPPLLEAWLFTEDSDIQPYRIVALDAASEIPRGDSIEPTTVEVAAVYVKRFNYASNSGTSVAPWLIAKKIHWVPPAAQDTSDQLTPILTAAICVAMTAIFGAFLMTLRRQSRRRIEFRLATADRDGPAADIACEPPDEFLASLDLGTTSQEFETGPDQPIGASARHDMDES